LRVASWGLIKPGIAGLVRFATYATHKKPAVSGTKGGQSTYLRNVAFVLPLASYNPNRSFK
jgi:hypothetical protein